MYRFLAVPTLLCLSALGAMASVDQGLLALVPANAKVVSSMNVQQAIHSPFGQFLLSNMNSDPNGLDKMAQETGFDPRRDLQTFIFASTGPAPGSTQAISVVLARGTFDSQMIRSTILSHQGTIQNFNGVDLYVSAKHEQHPSAFALAESDIAAFGDLAGVQQVIANRSTATSLDGNLQALINNVSASNDAWFASILPGSYLGHQLGQATSHQAQPQAQALQSVRQASGGVQFGDPVQVTFDAVARSPQDATSLVDVVRFMTSFMQMQRQNAPQASALAAAFDNMQLSASGSTFHASIAIPEKSLEQLASAGVGVGESHHHGFKAAKPSQQ